MGCRLSLAAAAVACLWALAALGQHPAGRAAEAFERFDRDGRPDFIAAVSPPVSLPGVAGTTTGNVQRSRRLTAIDELAVFLNEGGFRFREHRVEIRGSTLTPEQFAGRAFVAGRYEDIGGTDLITDFGGFYHDSAKDKAGPNLALRDLDGDGDLDLVQSCHIDLREPLLPYSPGEYRQGVFCWKSLFRETGETRFEKVTGNGLAVEARLRYNRDKQLYENASDAKAPGLPYLFFADVDNDGWQDALAVGPSDSSWSPRSEDVGGRFWRNLGGFRFEERTEAAGLAALNWDYRQWHAFFGQPMSDAHRRWRPRGATRSQPGLLSRHPLENRPYYADAIIGARVELTAGGRKQYRWVHSNHSDKSGGALDAHFGLGKATSAEVSVILLSGRTHTFSAVPLDRSHALMIVAP